MDQLNFAVIHELTKERGVNAAHSTLRANLLDITKPMVVRLATLLAGLLGRDQGAMYWGQFGDRRREGPFPGSVAEFAHNLSADHFSSLAHVAMDELVEYSSREALATGGFIFFASYVFRGVDYRYNSPFRTWIDHYADRLFL